jgi:hypothetical protein
MNRSYKIIVLTALLLSMSACGSTGEKQKLETLNDAIDNYAYALRWGRIDDAVAYHINKNGIKPEIDLALMKSIRVTGFTIRGRDVNPEQTEATVKGEFNYYHDQYGTLRTMEYTQNWWYQPETKKWFLDSEFPVFR